MHYTKRIILNIKTVLITLLILTTLAVNAQESDLYVQARTDEAAVTVSWFPTLPKDWEKNMETGYQVSRTEIDMEGNELSGAVLLSDQIFPKDSLWFAENSYLEDGLIQPIGALLHDPQFDFPENDIMDDIDMKFNFIIFETLTSSDIAQATGLGFYDTTAVFGKHYRYDVMSKDELFVGSVTITTLYPNFAKNMNNPVEFEFPGGVSLSEMYLAANPVEVDKIAAIARAYGDSIVLRWGPNNARLWERAQKEGYFIYRSVGDADYEFYDIVMPVPDSLIDESISEDSMALLAAGILYGDRSSYGIQNMSIGDQIGVNENYFGFALYAAERSPMAAAILGLRYVDTEVEKDSVYHYVIETKGIEVPFYKGSASLKNVYTPPPKPAGLVMEPGDKTLKLVWNLSNKENFSSYRIERSEDGVNYHPLTEKPLVFIETDRLELYEYSYVDSVGINDQTFYYRVFGFDSFSEISQPAEVESQAVDLTPPTAVRMIETSHLKEENQFFIKWMERGVAPADLASYQVMMSDDPEGFYSAVSPMILPGVDTFTMDVAGMELEDPYYFKVYSYDKSGNKSQSPSSQIAFADLTAPLPPEGLYGYVDSLSVVHLVWDHSTSKDAVGYWIYYGNDPNDELALLNTEMIEENTYAWYIDEISYLKKIYIAIRAEDDAYNKGVPSEVLAVTRLDKVPPIKPIIKVVQPSEGALEVQWEPSASDDVVGQLLYRNLNSEADSWHFLDSLTAETIVYRDTTVDIDTYYRYRLVAFDQSGNVSEPSFDKQGKMPFPEEVVIIQNLVVNASDSTGARRHVLNWQYKPINTQIANVPYQFEVYRSSGGNPIAFLAEVDSDNTQFIDDQIRKNVLYNYAVRIRFDNGWVGDLSEIKSILVK